MNALLETLVVNVSDVRVSNDPGTVLATYSLGSCIAVAAYDSVRRVGGMLHFQLPGSEIDRERGRQHPAMFADTGMALMFQQMAALGAEQRHLTIKLAGAAQMLADSSIFDIGRRNHTAIRKLLWQLGLFIKAEAIGGTAPRNLYLHIADGTVEMKSSGICSTL